MRTVLAWCLWGLCVSGCWLSHERPTVDASVSDAALADAALADVPRLADAPDAGPPPIEWLDPGPFEARVGPEARLLGMAYGDFALFHRPAATDVPVFQVVPVHGAWRPADAIPAEWAAGGSRVALWSGTRQLVFAVATDTEVRWAEWAGVWSDAMREPTLSPGRLPDEVAFPDLYNGPTHRTERLAVWTQSPDRESVIQGLVFEPLSVTARPWFATLDPTRDSRVLFDGETPVVLGFLLGDEDLSFQRDGEAAVRVEGCRGRIDAAWGRARELWIGCSGEAGSRLYVVRDGASPRLLWDVPSHGDSVPSVLPLQATSDGSVLFGYSREGRFVDVVWLGGRTPILGTLEVGDLHGSRLLLAESADPDTLYSPLYALAWTGGDVVRFRLR